MDFIVNPDKFFRNVKDKLGYKLPLFIVILSGIAGAINGYIIGSPIQRAVVRMLTERGLAESEIQTALIIVKVSSILTPIIMAFVVWFIIAVLIYLISLIFGGEGKFSTTLKLSAFSYIPSLVFFPLNLYISFETAKVIEYHGLKGFEEFGLIPTAVGMIVLTWQFFYWILITKNARDLEIRRAIATALIIFILFLIPNVYQIITKLAV